MNNKNAYHQRNGEKLLKRQKAYYKNNKERLKEQARNKYRELSNEEKSIKNRIWKKLISKYARKRQTKTKKIPTKIS